MSVPPQKLPPSGQSSAAEHFEQSDEGSASFGANKKPKQLKEECLTTFQAISGTDKPKEICALLGEWLDFWVEQIFGAKIDDKEKAFRDIRYYLTVYLNHAERRQEEIQKLIKRFNLQAKVLRAVPEKGIEGKALSPEEVANNIFINLEMFTKIYAQCPAAPARLLGVTDDNGNLQAAAEYEVRQQTGLLVVTHLATAPWNLFQDARGVQGAGRALVGEFINIMHANSTEQQFLLTLNAIPEAADFYRRLDFKEGGMGVGMVYAPEKK